MNTASPEGLNLLRFEPAADELLPRRAEYRAALLEAVRRGTPVYAAPQPSAAWTAHDAERGDRHDALCELLSCASFLVTDTATASFIGIPAYGEAKTSGDGSLPEVEDPDPETILSALYRRFDLESVILTDAGLAYDGEKYTPVG